MSWQEREMNIYGVEAKIHNKSPNSGSTMNRKEPGWLGTKTSVTHYKPATDLSKSEKLLIIRRSYGLCVYCGQRHFLGFDHIVPGSQGGSNTTDNIVACCRSCNSLKCHRDVESMRHHLALKDLRWPKMSRETMDWAAARGADMRPYLEWKLWFERGTTKGAIATRKLIEAASPCVEH